MSRRASGRGAPSRFIVGLAALCVLLAAGCGGEGGPPGGAERSPGPPVRDWPAGELRDGGSVEAELDRGESHAYRIPLEVGDLLRVRVEQDGVDVELVWKDPEGSVVLTADRPIAEYGPELVLAVAESADPYTLEVRAFEAHGPGRYRARIDALRPATAADRLAADTYRRFREAEEYAHHDRERAGRVWADALGTWRALGETALEGEVLARMGGDHYLAGESGLARRRFAQALAVFGATEETRWQLIVRDNLASLQLMEADYDAAVENYRAVARLARATGDRRQEASTLYGLGKIHRTRGELQRALAAYEGALALLPEDDVITRPLVLHNLGALYRVHFRDPDRARRHYLAARDLYRPEEQPTHAEFEARTLHQLALLAQEEGRTAEARGYLEEALSVRTAFDRCGRATALTSLARLEDEDGMRRAADARMAEAHSVLEGVPCAASEIALDLVAGELAERRGEADAARAAYRRGSDRAAEIGDRRRLADGLAGVARAERALGRLPEALDASRRVLAIVEEIRPTVLREDLRTAFFATVQDRYDLHVGLLSQMGRHAEAWAAAERARAQALRDLLAEAGAGLRRGADPALAKRERELRHRINRLESRRVEAASEDGAGSRELRRKIDDLVGEIERVRGEIRRQSPAYAAVAGREALSLEDLREELLDDGDTDTLLLEYRLGREESWLWVIGAETFEEFSLPPRDEIEPSARVASRWARSLQWPGHAPPPLCELSRTVLGPAVPLLEARRLVLVPDGALESVPFAALPDPAALADDPEACPEAPLLVDGHEIVHLPSAAALAAQRRLYRERPPAPKWLAVVADPVYGPEDERVSGDALPRPAGADGSRVGRFERLRYSGEEAAAILAGRPREKVLSATGLDASRATVASGVLSGHRIVHFATHGVHDPEQPLLSYLALSDGALRAHEIYDLELPAELVVLSACDTARGRPTRGEGLVSGLPRAFLYAGAERALVSLWPVQDRSTRDLMRLFYRGLVDRDLPPGRALQEAQRSLRRAGRPPHRWAGFILQGDWRPLSPFEP